MKNFKITLFIFGFLDAISILLMSSQIYSIGVNFSNVPDLPLSKIRVALLLISYPLLFVSAAGLLKAKKFGLIAYYIQFPIRLIVWVFSFGFITYLMEYTANETISDWLFRIPIILEFFRLYFTIHIHRDHFR